MRRFVAIVIAAAIAGPALAQTRRPQQRRPAAPPPAPLKKEAPEMRCPTPLGVGVKTRVSFCEINTGRDPASGVIIRFPPHRGPVTLSFNLHNRHLYSEEQVKAKRAYARYTATIGVLALDNTLISRAVVQSEFRTAADLFDRVGGGAGGGVKAVAPTGSEAVTIAVPEEEEAVSLLGEKLTVERIDESSRFDSRTYMQPDRPIADISNVMIEYRPAPAARGRSGGTGRTGGRGRGER
jgi:hypothetical protein